ncbi:MAG: Txe/YoeB family addiction module toxin [Coriobacteriales bacterium]|jgi:toxin YoeB|nr:Txe/YoeB family addiction module toxin [Coriobacteriales bacterium]
MHKDWHEKAWDDYLYWQTQDKKTVRKINALIKSIERGERLGKMERLKDGYSSWLSTRIDQSNRLIFKVADDVLIIASCRGQYS